jgi:hypothetical protein
MGGERSEDSSGHTEGGGGLGQACQLLEAVEHISHYNNLKPEAQDVGKKKPRTNK